MNCNRLFYIVFGLVSYCIIHISCSERKKLQKNYSEQAKEFIEFIRSTQFPDDTILLVDKPDIRDKTCIDEIFFDTALFTNDEEALIRTQIEKPLLNKWSRQFVDKVKIVSRDTLNAIFNDRNRSWNYFHKHYGKRYNSFSAPIFLRNNTLCIFYSGYVCGGLCGAGQVNLYKKEEGNWQLKRSFCYWVS